MVEKHALDGDAPDSKRPRLESPQQAPSRGTQTDQELAVGITAFVSPDTPNIACVVKQRYTDFLVNEISLDGHVVHLKSREYDERKEPEIRRKNHDAAVTAENAKTKILDSIQQKHKPEDATNSLVPDSESAQEGATANPKIDPPISNEGLAELRQAFGEETTSSIIDLWSSKLNNTHLKYWEDHGVVHSGTFPDVQTADVAIRAIISVTNRELRAVFLHNFDAAFADKRDEWRLHIRVQGRPSRVPPPDKRAWSNKAAKWHELGGDYLHFTLYKEGKDTMEVLGFLASRLKIPPNKFEFAGTKDRRAVTVQRVAVYHIHAPQVVALNKDARGFVVRDFEHKPHGLGLGDLGGNEFHLTLRECHVELGDNSVEEITNAVANAISSLRRNGFINYYGLQRFGSFSIGTHAVGRKILQGDLKGAIDSILSYDPAVLEPDAQEREALVPSDEIERARRIKHFKETGDTPDNMARRFTAERAIMAYLGSKDRHSGQYTRANDWQGALMQIQRNLRLMYVHAYQSLVWNTVAARRWELFGNIVKEGDLVVIGEKDSAAKAPLHDVDEDGRAVLHPVSADPVKASDDFTRARPLSKVEAESGRYDIFDIVLPLPGFDVIYPNNEIGKFYVDFMASETGGGLDPYNMRRIQKDFSLSGSYRKVMARPLKVEDPVIVKYDSAMDQLVRTDMDVINKQEKHGLITPDKDDRLIYTGDDDAKDKVAVIVKLQLASSQYATMALRELTNGGAINFTPQFSANR